MGVLYVTEYRRFARDERGQMGNFGMEPSVREQIIPFDPEGRSEPFREETTVLRLIADTDFHLEFGVDPGCTRISRFYKGGVEYWAGVDPDGRHRLRIAVCDDG